MDFGHELLNPDLERIADRLELGFERIPILAETGIKTTINGPFTFGPDGNPMIGPVPLAVTTNMSINFLRRPSPNDLIAKVRLLKLGRRLAVGEIFMFSDGSDKAVAHATGTYSIPSKDKR